MDEERHQIQNNFKIYEISFKDLYIMVNNIEIKIHVIV